MREAFMKKCLVVLTIFLLFMFLVACAGETPTVVGTVHPSAKPLLTTLAVIATTAEAIGQSATAYAATPTKSPDAKALKNLINNAIKDELITSFGAKITVADVKFGPIGAQEFTHLYIEMNCTGDNNTVCPTTQVIIAIIDACKAKKNKFLENVPYKTEKLTITIYDPAHSTIVVEADWSDVLNYINDKMPAGDLSKQITYTPY
jgi:hypothetical protein